MQLITFFDSRVKHGLLRLLVLFAACAAQCVHGQVPGAVDEKSGLNLRLETRIRYVYIDERDKPKQVDVTTARAVVGADVVLTPQLKVTVEMIHSDFLPPKRFTDDAAAFDSPYPLLPDPRYTGLNEAHVTWSPTPDWDIRLGRQSLTLGNERHVSDDNFRQIPQLFDGVSVRGSPMPSTQLTLGQFNRLRSRSGSANSMQLTLMELAFNPLRDMSVAAYAVRHRPQPQAFDIFRFGVADLSNWVVGAVVDGSYSLAALGSVTSIPAISEARGFYTFELANQRTAANEAALHARYLRAGVGVGWHGWITRIDHEVKGSSAGRYGFQTPLTNQYAFNGNTLQFFDTPTEGLRDTWTTVRWEQGPWSALGEYHWFRGDSDGRRFGRELDLNLTYTVNPRAYVRAQWARYVAAPNGFGVDTDKVWLTFGYQIK